MGYKPIGLSAYKVIWLSAYWAIKRLGYHGIRQGAYQAVWLYRLDYQAVGLYHLDYQAVEHSAIALVYQVIGLSGFRAIELSGYQDIGYWTIGLSQLGN